jgi:lipopolysaccharide transport system ATP-binding protein
MGNTMITVDSLSKRYSIGPRIHYGRLTESLWNAVRAPFERRSGAEPTPPKERDIWALKDVSLDVGEGEVVGVIGRNGAGKTTLLKILSRITEPTEGMAEIHGRVGSLLEVGTGFHPELTGRENVYLNGAILGMHRAEIARKFDEIVDFAEVARFIDTPVKRYSTGMGVRLAFAVAAHLETEILMVDEVLSVGDLPFQRKCLGKMDDVATGGRTILFVSHQMNQIRRLCDRVVWLDSGTVRLEGKTAEVVGAYETAMVGSELERGDPSDRPSVRARFLSWQIVKPEGDPHVLSTLDPVTVRFLMQVNEPIRMGRHEIQLRNVEGQLLWGWDRNRLTFEPGIYQLEHSFPTLPLRPGVYSWQLNLRDEHGTVEKWYALPEMVVDTESYQHHRDDAIGLLNLPSEMKIESMEEAGDGPVADGVRRP